jgi:hypothetical protein
MSILRYLIINLFLVLSYSTAHSSLVIQTENIDSILSDANLTSYRKLFPGAKDPRIMNVYEIHFDGPIDLNLKLKELKNTKGIQFIERSFQVERMSIIPKIRSDRKDYFDNQWFLKNTGQSLYHRYDYDLPVVYEGQKAFDSNYEYIKKHIDPKIDYAVVAVVDSGVSSHHREHLELKDKILRNEEECGSNKGSDPKYPFPGDCEGYNFAALVDSDKTSVEDFDGHGTHIAGIIAANDDNEGVTGISQKIKILPVKVFLDPDEYLVYEDKDIDITLKSLTTSVAEGIYYSIFRNVDVINLSLGWPPLLDSELIRRLLEIAKEKDIIVVAAAGNDNSYSAVKPCAHRSVVCVGSAGIDSKVSDFSNFGQHVDFFAPGDYILSSFPNRKSLVFPSNFYEYLSGSSQSAPIIAAYFALAKKLHPNLDSQSLKRLLALSASSAYPKGLYFFPDIKKIHRSHQLESLLPDFKDNEFLSFNAEGEANYSFSFIGEANPKTLEELDLQVSLTNKNYSVKKTDCNIISQEEIGCTLSFKALNENAENLIDFDLFWTSNDKTRKAKLYLHAGRLANANHQIFLAKANKKLSLKSPVPILKQKWSEYFYFETNNELRVVSILNENHGFSFPINEKESLLSLYIGDLNYDRQDDFLLITATYKTSDKKEQIGQNYYYLGQDGKALFSEFSFLKLEEPRLGINVLNIDSIQWKALERSFGKIAVPVLWGSRGLVKDKSLPKIYGAQINSNQAVYEYDVKNCGVHKCLSPKIIDNNLFYKNLRDKLKHLNHNVIVSNLLVQGEESYYKGKIRALLSMGEGKLGDQYLLTLDSEGKQSIEKIQSSVTSLIGQAVNPVFDITDNKNISAFNYYFPSQYKLRYAVVDTENKKLSSSYFNKDPESPSIGVLLSYKDQEGVKHLSFNNKSLFLRSHDKQSVLNEKRILKNTIVPHTSLSQSYIPLLRKTDKSDRYLPVLFVEESNIEAHQVHFLEINGSKLSGKMMHKFKIPANCEVENPAMDRTQRDLYLILSCYEEIDSKSEEYYHYLRSIAL